VGVILLKIQGETPVVGSTSHRRMQETERHLEQLIRHCGLQSVRNSYGTHEATFSHVEIREKCGINYLKSKTHFFSLKRREKTEVLRGYCRDRVLKNICWVLSLVQGYFVVRE